MANSVYQNALRKKGLESQSNVCRGEGQVPYAPQDIKAKSLVNKIFTRLLLFPEVQENAVRSMSHAGYAVDRKKTRRYGRSVIRPGRGLRNGPFLSPNPPIPTSLQTSRTVFTDDRDAGKENPVIPYRNRPAHLKKKSQSLSFVFDIMYFHRPHYATKSLRIKLYFVILIPKRFTFTNYQKLMLMSKKITLSLVCILAVVGCAFAQSDQVRGSVVDENGAPIIGATVIVKDDPTIGTSTDLKGEFLLQIPARKGGGSCKFPM